MNWIPFSKTAKAMYAWLRRLRGRDVEVIEVHRYRPEDLPSPMRLYPWTAWELDKRKAEAEGRIIDVTVGAKATDLQKYSLAAPDDTDAETGGHFG